MQTNEAGTADLVLKNGKIYTVDRDRRWVEAVAIKSGRILALGTGAEMRDFAGDTTEVVDLQGRMAMPGIIDIHNHHTLGGAGRASRIEISRLRQP